MRAKINLGAWRQYVRRVVGKTTRGVAESVPGALGYLMTLPKSGRRYGAHVASAPGEPAAKRSGAYLRSVRVRIFSAWRAVVAIGVKYAGYLEKGTRRMAARPTAQPAARRTSETWRRASLGAKRS